MTEFELTEFEYVLFAYSLISYPPRVTEELDQNVKKVCKLTVSRCTLYLIWKWSLLLAWRDIP